MTGTVLVVSPHPDDETLGIGATLSALIDEGWSVRNLACTLGRPEDRVRRREELREAGRRMGFETTVMDPPARISGSDDLEAAAIAVASEVTRMMETFAPEIVVSPHLNDGHHGHEAVAHGVKQALEASTNGPLWWTYGIWTDLPKPNVFFAYDEERMDKVVSTIEAYQGENDRSHYDVMYPARAVVHRALGSERVFGYGTSSATSMHYADLITETRHTVRGWEFAKPRMLDVSKPTEGTWDYGNVSWWLGQPSLREQWGQRSA